MNENEVVLDPSSAKTKEEYDEILRRNEAAKAAHSARKEQEMLDRPSLFERATNKIKELFGIKKKEQEEQIAKAAELKNQKEY